MEKKIYLDSANSTYLNNEVLTEMMPVLSNSYALAGDLYDSARVSKEYVLKSRRRIAKAIGSRSHEVYFALNTNQANFWAIIGLARANRYKGNHIIVSKIEDEAILSACRVLENEGFKVSYIPVDSNGMVMLNHLMHEIKNTTILVSVSFANGIVGTIQNVNAIARTVKERDIIFHCDASHAFGLININVRDLNIDAMTISSKNIQGPFGVSALYVKDGIEIENITGDGDQDFDHGQNIENIAGVVGFGKAVELASQNIMFNVHKLKQIRDYFTKQVQEKIPFVHIVGHKQQRLSNIVSLAFEFIDSKALCMLLDREGIEAFATSNCMNKNLKYNAVLSAMNIDKELMKTVVRFSFAKNITKEDVDYAVEKIEKCVKILRDISPLHISTVKEVI